MPDVGPKGQRLLVAHDLPAPVTKIAEDIGRLGDGWYLPRDEVALVSELLQHVGAFEIAAADGEVTVTWRGGQAIFATVAEALMAAHEDTKT